MTTAPTVLTAASELAAGTTSERFDGAVHGGRIPISFFLNHMPPGGSAAPHRHPYGEVFLLADGKARFDVERSSFASHVGQVVNVPPGAVHGFTNTGDRPLEM